MIRSSAVAMLEFHTLQLTEPDFYRECPEKRCSVLKQLFTPLQDSFGLNSLVENIHEKLGVRVLDCTALQATERSKKLAFNLPNGKVCVTRFL
ncbi:hypothetical protein AAMO2058_000111800 [Amorphochlora amoebiformis]